MVCAQTKPSRARLGTIEKSCHFSVSQRMGGEVVVDLRARLQNMRQTALSLQEVYIWWLRIATTCIIAVLRQLILQLQGLWNTLINCRMSIIQLEPYIQLESYIQL